MKCLEPLLCCLVTSILTCSWLFLLLLPLLTIFVHAGLEASLQSTRLTLVTMGPVDRAHACACLTPTRQPSNSVNISKDLITWIRGEDFHKEKTRGRVCYGSSSPVDEPSSDTPLEEATAAIAGIDAVVFSTACVRTHFTQQA